MSKRKGNKNSSTTRLSEEFKAELRREQAPYLERGVEAPSFEDLLQTAWTFYKSGGRTTGIHSVPSNDPAAPHIAAVTYPPVEVPLQDTENVEDGSPVDPASEAGTDHDSGVAEFFQAAGRVDRDAETPKETRSRVGKKKG